MKNNIMPLLWLLLILALGSCEKTEPLPSDANEVFNSPLSPSTFDYNPFDDPTVPFYINPGTILDHGDHYEIHFEFVENPNYGATFLSIDWSVDANFLGNDCQSYSTSYSTINPSITIPKSCGDSWFLTVIVNVDYGSGNLFTCIFNHSPATSSTDGTILTLVLP